MKKKVQLKYDALKEEMYKLTGSAGPKNISEIFHDEMSTYKFNSKLNYIPRSNFPPGNFVNIPYSTQGLPQFVEPYNINNELLILFYGFNGMLAQKYSVLQNMSRDEIAARMIIAGDKIPWKIERLQNFENLLNMFQGTPNALVEIPFEDAMNIIRIGVQEVKVDDFEDAEVDEFDDNCVDTCRPGLHECGK